MEAGRALRAPVSIHSSPATPGATDEVHGKEEEEAVLEVALGFDSNGVSDFLERLLQGDVGA